MTRDISPLERLRRSGISPEKSLGQNFLIDPNILGVIERLASLGPDDLVLEVGPGLGVLTARLLERCRLVHCVEVDERLARHLEEEFAASDNLRLHLVDAMKADLAALQPPPDKFVSNLPYNIAAPLVMRSLTELPTVGFWCLMLQKEVADRLFAVTGAANYGGISVMMRLACEKLSSRPVSGNVFYPRPRVKSSLLAFRRIEPAVLSGDGFTAVKALVYGSFSHRRKTLVNSLSEAEDHHLPAPLVQLAQAARKQLIEEALASAGLPVNVRPQDLTPEQYLQLSARLEAAA
ncbi:MAG: ribosomal RNA small subunit methyltransferase A [Gaiellales bacterium]|nr:MAG: ribosomal RNA small subunit methyltransferase A [Gaiellales bacterium]